MRRVLALALTSALAACSFAPPKVAPEPVIPSGWPVGDAYLKTTESSLPKVGYRDLFHDPKLQKLIEHAIADNQDLKVALANVDAARATARVRRAAIFPQVNAGAGVTIADRGSASASSGTIGRTKTFDVDVGLSAFEIDLFGRLRNLSDAAFQDYLSTESAARAARLTLVAEVASAYLTIATDRSLLAIARDTETSATRSVELTQARLSGGVAPRMDLRQAETILAQAEADRALLVTQAAQDRNALELLVGAPVADTDLPDSIEAIDGMLGELPAGLDSHVLLRRPDVVQAEYTLYAANGRIGAARAAFFPTVSLTTVAGFASTSLSGLFAHDAFAWSVAPGISLPLFDAGARQGNLEFARATSDAAVASYQRAIQTAFREVADALARRGTIAAQVAAQRRLADAAQDTNMLADARYREGVDSFLASLDAQRTLYTARKSLATVRGTRAENLVTIFRVLGGNVE